MQDWSQGFTYNALGQELKLLADDDEKDAQNHKPGYHKNANVGAPPAKKIY